jgi:hypothetical protein
MVLYHVQAIGSVTSYYGVPYSFIMLATSYNPMLRQSWRLGKFLPYLLLLPPIACLLFTPWYTVENPVDFPIVSL